MRKTSIILSLLLLSLLSAHAEDKDDRPVLCLEGYYCVTVISENNDSSIVDGMALFFFDKESSADFAHRKVLGERRRGKDDAVALQLASLSMPLLERHSLAEGIDTEMYSLSGKNITLNGKTAGLAIRRDSIVTVSLDNLAGKGEEGVALSSLKMVTRIPLHLEKFIEEEKYICKDSLPLKSIDDITRFSNEQLLRQKRMFYYHVGAKDDPEAKDYIVIPSFEVSDKAWLTRSTAKKLRKKKSTATEFSVWRTK